MTDQPETVPPRKGLPTRIGPYQISGLLGSGGFGTVYRAQDPEGRAIALKVLASHFASVDMRRRFAREGTIRIDHPNVVTVYDAGTTPEGDDFIALELLEGEPLNKFLEQTPRPPKEAVSLGISVARGLAAAHDLGIVHRDLKPGNVFMCDDGTVKVLDFGIARWLEPDPGAQLTREGSVVGTPGYLSPEQARGSRDVDARTDVWALGVILYHALSGVQPFLRDSSVATILAVVLEQADPVAKHAPSLPEGLADIVDRCLAKDPDSRWPNARALAEALRAVDLDARTTRISHVGAVATSLPPDEHRVVALLLASGVSDLASLERAVHDWGGELIPMVGQRAIGIFGGRRWEGDETRRAASAALVARGAAAHVAIASGRATGAGGTVSGDAVRAVERACAAGRPGVAVDAGAARSLEGFPLEEIAPGLFEIPEGASERPSHGPGVRDETPLLGRGAEMAQLKAAVSMMLEERRPVVALITGPPGIGKTRLKSELVQHIAKEGGVRVLHGAGESHRRGASLNLIGSVVRAAALAASDVDRRTSLVRFCEEALDDASWARESADALGRLLGLEAVSFSAATRVSDPQLLSDKVRLALADVLVGLAESGPLALVVDDAQWADDASLDFLEELLTRLESSPVLLVLSTRPELVDERVSLFAGLDVIRVQPRNLVASQVGDLARAIAGRDLRDPVVRAVTTRSGGNPFFVEQIVRELSEKSLLDADLDELPIPLTVEAAVQSRLDHLPPEEKKLLQRASVFGLSFDIAALHDLGVDHGEGLVNALVRRGLVGFKNRDKTEAELKSTLVADVAYRMLADHTRVELHRRAAGFLEMRADTDPEVVGRHHELGGDATRAAEWYERAAPAASRRGDSASVLRCSEKAIDLGIADERRFALHMARADALSFTGRRDDQGKEIDLALEHAKSAVQRARSLSERVALFAATGAHDRAMQVAPEAVRAARECGDADALATALVRQGWASLYVGQLDAASDVIGEASALSGLSRETAALVAAWRAQLATARGDLGARLDAFQRAVELYREAGDLRRAAQEESNLADTFNRLGLYAEAERALRAALDMTRRVGNHVAEAFALANLGYALAHQRRTDDALEALAAAERLAGEVGHKYLGVWIRLYRARALLFAGELEAAVREAEATADDARRNDIPLLSVLALALAARGWLERGDAQMALDLSKRAMTLHDELGGMEEDETEVFLGHARALLASGDREGARAAAARGKARLADIANRIADPELRKRFLSDVTENAALSTFDAG